MNVGVINLQYSNNFGAMVCAYALIYILRDHHVVQVVNYIPENNYNIIKKFALFRNQFLNLGVAVSLNTALSSYYDHLDAVVVGSDQVFRLAYNSVKSPNFMEWMHGKKLFISYAASFGIDHFEGGSLARKKVSKLLSRFDAHSVRESSGVHIMKNTFGLDAIQVLDPTLLLDPKDYQPIIDSEPCAQPEKYVGVMFLDDEHWDEFRASALYKKLSAEYEIVNICKDEQGEFRSVPQWLSYIKHASLMVTDSFHGTVFSIIYRKQFITRATANRGNARLESLCSTLDIPLSRFCPSFDKKNDTQFDTPLDFAPVWKRIEEERVVSLDYLKRSLAMEPTYKEFIPVRRDRLSIPILSIEEREHDKRLLLFGCIPVVCKPLKGNSMYLLGKIPFSRETLSGLKRRLFKR